MTDELKKIEKMFLDGSEDIHSVMDASPVMLWLAEENLPIYLNASWRTFIGKRDVTETNKRRLEDIHPVEDVHPEDLDSCWEIIHPAFHAHTPYEIKYRLKHSSGEYRWVKESGVPLFSRDGAFRGFVGSCEDINNQKKIELQLLASEQRYLRLFETARDGILILDSQTGEITDVNPFLMELLGYSKEEFLGKKLWEVGAFKNIRASKETFRLLQDTGYVRYEDLPLETKDGRLIEVEFVSNAYMVGEDRVMQCNIRDISTRKRVEAAEKAIVFLEQEKLKTKFIADATHELRTPLAIIKGNVELALRDKSKKNYPTETFKAINVEINHLAELLSDLTILTTENQNIQQKMTKSKVNLTDIISSVVERCSTLTTEKHISIDVKEMPDVSLIGDRVYLEKLFSNIVSNAIYYGKEKGSVIISAEKNKKLVTVSITDNGIGISEEDIPNIFNRFYRADNGKVINQAGTGLGLAISKWIVEAHDGSIEVKSVFKKGTTFIVSLPISE